MSHFTVAVFHYPNDDLDEILAPYDENITVEPYIDMTKSQAIEYVRTFFNFKDKTDEELYQMAVNIMGEVDEDGNIYSNRNPKAKWDWWTIGGRWSGMLKLKNKDEYTDSACVEDIDFDDEPIVTFAVITIDGEWHEKGEMGYWACYKANEDTDDWDSNFRKRFIDTADPNWILTIVDCHI